MMFGNLISGAIRGMNKNINLRDMQLLLVLLADFDFPNSAAH